MFGSETFSDIVAEQEFGERLSINGSCELMFIT